MRGIQGVKKPLHRILRLMLALSMSVVSVRMLLPEHLWSLIEPRARAIDYVVTNTNDSGTGSLRQAILDANSDGSSGVVRITFSIPGSGVRTISPMSGLPAITRAMTIDGTTQPGYSGAPIIELNGANSPPAHGLFCQAPVTIRGLVINRFSGGAGITLFTNNSIITGNYIGTNAAGNAALGNRDGIIARGINNTIGGVIAGARNIISGNLADGIDLDGSANVIQGNYIGTDVTGTFSLGNSLGIFIFFGTNRIGGTTAAEANVISSNRNFGIFIETSGNVVQGNYIGTNARGDAPLGNGIGVVIEDVRMFGTNDNIIGGTAAGARNVISGNLSHGIEVFNGTNNLIQGNLMGTDVTGTIDLGNGGTGIYIRQANNTTIGGAVAGSRNVISGNGGQGIHVESLGNTVQGNFIGTDATGTVDLGNDTHGIFLAGNQNTVGGTVGARNVISGNGGYGIRLDSSGNLVQGNFIGTNATGIQAIGNSADGIGILGSNNQIGGTTSLARNLISGNFESGIEVSGSGATGNSIRGNYIGTNAAGSSAIPNAEGILLSQSASLNTIGGTTPGAGNIIAFNSFFGIRATSNTLRNAIQGNSIFTNGGLGIDLLNPVGITPNDAGDADTGANNLQNYPVLTSVIPAMGNTIIQGTLNSVPGLSFRVELFSNNNCDPSGNGEGQAFVGFTNVNTDAGGNGSFSITVPTASITGPYLTATATDVNGNTSEFTPCLSTCIPALTPLGAAFPGNIGTGTPLLTGSIQVSVPTGCAWTAVSNDGFLSVTGGSGSGNGTVTYSLTPNPSSTTSRIGTISIAGKPFTVRQGPQFLDVPAGHPFYTVIGILAAHGITLGCGGGNYCPDAPVTREQMAAFIIRALGMPNPPPPAQQRFADVPPANPFYAFIEQMAIRGITLGCGTNATGQPIYCPGSPVTREQMAAFIIRALGEFNPPTPMNQRFTDVPLTNPFYAFIERMAQLQITLGCSTNPPLYCPANAVTRGQMAAFLVRAFAL